MVDPRDIRIVETTPGGARRSMTGPELAEEEYSPQGVSSIGEAGAIDMTGVAEYQVCCQLANFCIFLKIFSMWFRKETLSKQQCCMLLG